MKLCLINIPYLQVYGKINVGHNSSYPIGLGYIASTVRARGHEILLLDPEAEGISLEAVLSRIASFKPDLIGLSSVTANVNMLFQWAEHIKKRFSILIMAGGVHVTALPGKSLQDCPDLDFIVRGEGEYIVADICDAIQKKNLQLKNISSLCYRENGTVHMTPKSDIIKDLDAIPFPDRSQVNVRWYRLQPQFERGTLSATILSSRGCPASCTFCGNVVTGRIFRSRSAANFLQELEFLVKHYNIKHFHIVDDNFTADRQRAMDICQEIINRRLRITWFIFGRIDHLHDEELLKIMKQAGCVYILFGIESGSQHILDNLKKNITLKQIEETCRMCRKIGIQYFNSFMLGCPGETQDTVKQTVDCAIKLKSVMAGFNIMIPFPGTPVAQKYYKEEMQKIADWTHWCSVGDEVPFQYKHTNLTSQELLRIVARSYMRYYMRPAQILRIILFGLNMRVLVSYVRGAFGLMKASYYWFKRGTC